MVALAFIFFKSLSLPKLQDDFIVYNVAMAHIEKEYKIKLDKKSYDRLREALEPLDTYTQTNHYYSAPKGMGMRIRQRDGKHTFTLKWHRDGKVLEYETEVESQDIKDPAIQTILKEVGASSPIYLGDLITVRSDRHYPKATLSLDKSSYLGITSYELEYELKDSEVDDIENLKEVMEMTGIDIVFSNETKYQRFLKASTAKAAIFCADGLEECEVLITMDLLKRAGVHVELVSMKDDVNVTSSHELTFRCDTTFADIDKNAYDVLILPGGLKGTETLGAHKELVDLLLKYHDEGKLIAAICAAPSIFVKNGLVKDGGFTVYPGFECGLKSASSKVYCADNVITGKGVGAAIDFSYAIITYLLGEEKAKTILEEIQY